MRALAADASPFTGPADRLSPADARQRGDRLVPSSTVLHVYGATRPQGRGDTHHLARLASAGWRPVLNLPADVAWNHIAADAEVAEVHVVRSSARTNGKARRATWPVRYITRRAWGLRVLGVAIVHAHDDVAASVWALSARRAQVPMVWDVDLRMPMSMADTLRLAGSSHLITTASGARLQRRRSLPPRRSAGSQVHTWYDLASDTVDGQISAPTTICDVYACLTGLDPARAIDIRDHAVGAPDGATVER